jgi:hypothetical protein
VRDEGLEPHPTTDTPRRPRSSPRRSHHLAAMPHGSAPARLAHRPGSPPCGGSPSRHTPHPANGPWLSDRPVHTAPASAPDTPASPVVPLGSLP